MWGGIVNDAATLGITGGPIQDGIEGYKSINVGQYGKFFISGYNIYDGVSTINEDIDKVKGK